MEVEHKENYGITKTIFPVMFQTECYVCGKWYRWERMWKFIKDGPYYFANGSYFTYYEYVCQNCANTHGEARAAIDKIKFEFKKRIAPPIGDTGESR